MNENFAKNSKEIQFTANFYSLEMVRDTNFNGN